MPRGIRFFVGFDLTGPVRQGWRNLPFGGYVATQAWLQLILMAMDLTAGPNGSAWASLPSNPR